MHVAAGARLVDFAGWEMPVLYTGVIDEHMAVRGSAGLFDVSHMGEASVRGPQALDYLQKLTCNNVERLKPGRAHYTALTLPNGAFVDDLLVYMLGEGDYLLVLNAANTAKDVTWLEEHVGGFDAVVEDVSAEWAQIALQGPEAEGILQTMVGQDLAAMKYYGFVRAELGGGECIVSRTGYTGEDGFEIYGPPLTAEPVWKSLVEAGSDRGLVPVGLGARDTLRLEAKMALYGNDIDDTTTVIEADLGWIVKLKKGDFIGRDVLAKQKSEGVERKLVGFEMRGRAIARNGYPALRNGEAVGRVTSGTRAPFLQRNIGLAYLPQGMWDPGTEFDVEIRGRAEPAVVVPTPFYKRER
jgi:aminomethyltransferase